MMAALLWARLIFLSALAGIVGLCVWTAYRTNERECARGQTRAFFRTRTNEGRRR